MAEQLVDEPVPSFDDFELFEEEEVEEEQPRVVPEPYFRDAAGREWCLVIGPEGVYWWVISTSTGGVRRQARAEKNTGRSGDSDG